MSTSIFVFGSNEAGRHGAGAALFARQHHGAVYGHGVGRQGMAYGIPTKDRNIRTLPIERIAPYVAQFLEYARAHPQLQFEVTRIGCGLAGYTDTQIAPLFEAAPANCLLSHEWRQVLATGSEPPSPANCQDRYAVGHVRFDAKDGLGVVPDNGNVVHKGFVALMRPSRFLALAPGRREQESDRWLADQVRSGRPLAPPFLDLGLLLKAVPARVRAHEGRNRMLAIQQLLGDVPVPVHMFLGPERAVDLDEGRIQVLADALTPQRGVEPLSSNFTEAFWQGQRLNLQSCNEEDAPCLMRP